MRRAAALAALVALVALAPAACGARAGAGAEEAAMARFEEHCASCHGLDGRGRGPVAMSLNPAPRDWTDPDWQAAVTDEDLALVILEGGEALGLSSGMPPSPLHDRPDVVQALVRIVRGFGR